MYSLKLCCAVFIIFNIVIIDGNETSNIYKDCISEKGFSSADYEDVKNMHNTIPKTKRGLCFAACILKKQGFMLSDNRISLSKYIELLSELDTFNVGLINEKTVMIDIYKKCISEDTVSDECKAAKNFLECIANEKHRIENFFTI